MGILISVLSALLSGIALFPAAVEASVTPDPIKPADFQNLVKEGVNPDALKMSIKAYDWANEKGKVKKPVMTVIDFNKPSSQKRMWVIDMHNTPKVVYSGLVTHGHNSGGLYATHFSNTDDSHESSVGAMIASEPYYGKYGHSVKVDGLEKGINDNIRERDIEFHPSTYATPQYLRNAGTLGRSWGCFAIDPKYSNAVFNEIQNGSFVFVYANAEKNDKNFA